MADETRNPNLHVTRLSQSEHEISLKVSYNKQSYFTPVTITATAGKCSAVEVTLLPGYVLIKKQEIVVFSMLQEILCILSQIKL